MNNLVINKLNFGKVLDEFYSIIKEEKKNIIIKYEIIDNINVKKSMNSFLKEIEKNPIKSDINPLSFQQNIRNEWK